MGWLSLFGTVALAGAAQVLLFYRRCSRRVKWVPALLVTVVLVTCWLGVLNLLPLPWTCWIDGGQGFFSMPDYFFIAVLYGPAALLGVIVGAMFGCARW